MVTMKTKEEETNTGPMRPPYRNDIASVSVFFATFVEAEISRPARN